MNHLFIIHHQRVRCSTGHSSSAAGLGIAMHGCGSASAPASVLCTQETKACKKSYLDDIVSNILECLTDNRMIGCQQVNFQLREKLVNIVNDCCHDHDSYSGCDCIGEINRWCTILGILNQGK